ncbi:kinesin [Chloropicon primus]|uniref:Kinesin n=2 Tax=Chloropicon primus TaxID=1764295 RepID=A0A5B8MMH7_9CHLO|nr:kinesin [Chloropicon primus]UPR00691.1 kinesin [Chloropicon primus]|eukprot:QDZ21481.1 kinesin [Chloropicon primus]
MLRNKPDWTEKGSRGVGFQTVVHVKSARDKDTKQLVLSRNAVSILKPGRARVEPEDEFVVDAVFGQETTASDVARNAIKPLVTKLVGGENVYVFLFGAAETSKTDLLEGDGEKGGSNLVDLAASELFRALSAKNKDVMDYLATVRDQGQGSRSHQYDFFVESSFAEVYNERCRCLFSPGGRPDELSVAEDENEGYRLQGQVMKTCSDAQELSRDYAKGLSNRDKRMTDIGNSEERTSTVFSISVDQLVPPAYLSQRRQQGGASSSSSSSSEAAAGTQKKHQVHLKSKLTFVNLPGTERLLMDPDVLRAREGVSLNKSLLTFAQCLRRLGSGEMDAGTDFLAEESTLTKLVQDGLGGNANCLMIATLKTDSRNDWQQNIATMRYVSLARRVRNFPCCNDDATRALFKRLRSRLIHLKDQRESLSDHLKDVPAFGDVEAGANYAAKLHQMERLLLEEKERSADVLEECHALQSRLNDSAERDKEVSLEKVNLQEALIKSEEERLEIAKALIDFQVEHNQGIAEAERTKFDLEKRVLELETQVVEREVKEGEHERAQGELKDQAHKLEEEKQNYQAESEKLTDELEPLREKVKALEVENEDFRSKSELYEAALDENRNLRSDNSQKDTQVQELQSEASDLRRELDRLRNDLSLLRLDRDGEQESHVKQLEGLFQEVSELNRFVRLSYTDPESEVVKARGITSPTALSEKSEELLQALEDVQVKRHKTLRTELESVQQRYGDLSRRFRALYRAYRELRYRFEEGEELGSSSTDAVAGQAEGGHVVMHEDDICKGDEPLPPGEAHLRKEILEAEEKIIKLERKLKRQEIMLENTARDQDTRYDEVVEGANYKSVAPPPSLGLSGVPANPAAGQQQQQQQQQQDEGDSQLAMENQRLKKEIEALKSRPPNTPEDRVRRENEVLHAQLQELEGADRTRVQLSMDIVKLKAEIDKLRQGANFGANDLQQQLKEFTMQTQVELETEIASLESRCAMAEEQLNSTNRYWAQASLAYQKEIMRLRTVVGRYDPDSLNGDLNSAMGLAGLPSH